MKRSQINRAIQEAQIAFSRAGWALPPRPRWDVTDFGLGDFASRGLVLVNLAEEPEYCEKLMFAAPNQRTPAHTHRRKKEDIIVRHGCLQIQLWSGKPGAPGLVAQVRINGGDTNCDSGTVLELNAGERITLFPGVYHEFWPVSEGCVIGEVSTANDDAHDNFFADPAIGRFPDIEEDEPPLVKLISER